jgi:hypothetical protein
MRRNFRAEYVWRASLSLLGALIVAPRGAARRQYLTGDDAAGSGDAVGSAGLPGSEIAGRSRAASPASMRINFASAAWRSANVAAGPMQRNHSAVDVMNIDIFGPPDVEGKRS